MVRKLSTGTVSNEPYSVDSDEDEEPASKRSKTGSAAIPVVDLASDDDDNALSALAATYESGESQSSPERKDSGGNAVFSTPVHMNANAGASSSINKTHTPNKGWEKDRDPTCASRIL